METIGIALACEPIRCAPDSSPTSTESSGDGPGDLVVDILLDSFETAWMGAPAASVRTAATPARASPAPVHPMLIPSNRAALPSTSPATTHSPSLPSKRPHDGDGPHDARSALSNAWAPPAYSALVPPSPQGNSSSSCDKHAVPAHSAPVPAPASRATAAGGNADVKEFASVFFSPIPLSCLNITRSGDSLDSSVMDAASLGSPADGILRPGMVSLAAAVVQEGDEWEEAQATAVMDRHTPVASCAILSQAVKEEEQHKQGSRLNDQSTSRTVSLNTEAAGRSRLAAQDVASSNTSQPTTQMLSPAWTCAAPAPASTSAPVDRGSDTPSPSANRRPAAASAKRTAPLDPNGLHPILSLPPASASSQAKAAKAATRSDGDAQETQSALRPALQVAQSSVAAAGAAPTAPVSPPPVIVVPCGDEVLPAVVAPLPHLQQPSTSIAAAVRPQARAGAAPTLRLVAATAMIPHIDKVDKGGEDAYCVCTAGLGAIGVADGVSGWADEGIDPAAYSRTLMQHASDALARAAKPCGQGADAREVIRYAHHATVMAGSSTICVAVMQPSGKLQVANLGDSGVRIIRNGLIVFASEAQQHMFNMPFQLSHPSIIESPDDADSAAVTAIDVLPGDIIVLATDGLFDNVFDEEIASICTHALASDRRGPGGGAGLEADARALAEAVAFTAHRYAQDPHQRTPWSVAASETGMSWARFFTKGGGKMDDVTVVVAIVAEDGAHR